MKKIISTALAVLAMAACTRVEINIDQPNNEIKFGNAVQDYVTRAQVITNDNFDGFNVWGFYKDTDATTIFEGDDVTKSGNVWGYEGPTRYWIPDRNYYFAGVAPMDSDNIAVSTAMNMDSEHPITSITFTNTGTEDLIFGEYTYSANYKDSNNQPIDIPAVALKFGHLLSKVKVSFKNSVDPYINVKVSNIKISVPAGGSIDLTAANKTWTINEELENYVIETANADNTSLLITPTATGISEDLFFIPCTTSYNLEFDVTLVMEGVAEVLYHKTHEATIPATALVMGKAYNFSAEILPGILTGNQNDISFEVKHIKDWNTFSSYSQILVASKLAGEVTLQGPVEYSSTIDVVDNLTINLNKNSILYNNSTGYLFNVINGAVPHPASEDGTTTLTINGKNSDGSKITSDASTPIATVSTDNQIIINGGHHTASGSTVYEANGGKIYVKGGKFERPVNDTYSDSTKLFKQSNSGEVIITGGSFYRWNPLNYTYDANIYKPIYYLPHEKDTLMIKNKEWFNIKRKEETNTSPDTSMDDLLEDEIVGKITVNDRFITRDGIFIYNDVVIDFQNVPCKFERYTNKYWYGINISNGAEVVIRNANIYASDGISIQGTGSKLTFESGIYQISTINGRYMFYMVNAICIINGGKFINNSINNKGTTSISHFYLGGDSRLYINGGEWGTEGINLTNNNYIQGTSKVYITGGKFGQYFYVTSNKMSISSEAELIITGGSFVNRPADSYIGEGYKISEKDSNGMYNVVLDD